MRVLLTALLALAVAASPAMAGDDTKKDAGDTKATPSTSASDSSKTATTESSPALEAELQQMRELLQAQAAQLEQQRVALERAEEKVQALESRFSPPAPNTEATVAPGPEVKLATPLADGNGTGTGQPSDQSGPDSIHYKGVTLTPGGFVAAESVYRQHAISADINTPFNSIPFPGNGLGQLAENSFTARQSRVSLLSQSQIGSTKLTGYYEADWLGTGVTSNNRQSNSYVFRQRVLFGQAKMDSGWSFTGGQMWTLATEDRQGIDNRAEAIPLTIDPQYQVGFTWARQYGFRVVKSFGDKFALAFAVEGPQATIGGRGFSTVTTDNVGSASVSTVGNFFVDAPGSGGGLLNFSDTTGYSVNKAPDFIFKAAADPGWGHYELFGIVSVFRDRIYPCAVVGTNANDTNPPATTTTIACPVDGTTAPSATGAYDDSRTGGGIGLNLRVPLGTKKVEFAFQGLGGDGIGRYGSAQLADMTFRPDGTASLIRTVHGLGELEFHPSKKLDIFAYYGSEYAWRSAYQGYDSITITKTPEIQIAAPGTSIPAGITTAFKTGQIGGYGSPYANNSGCSTEEPPSNDITPGGSGSCAGDTRIISEFTIGFWHKIYNGPMGGLRWGVQYSYFDKLGWSGNNSSPSSSTPGASISPKATENMLWTSFRYYIP
jgi:hypothetical protein